MMISIFVFLFYFVFFIKSYRKALISMVIMNVWLTHVQFMDTMTLFNALSIVACFLFFIVGRSWNKFILKFPLLPALLLMLASIILTTLFSDGPKRPSYLIQVIPSYFCIIIFWILIKTKPYSFLKFSAKCLLFYGFVVSLFSMIETILGRNIYIEFINSLDLYSRDYLISEVRYGFKRSQSIFSMHTTNGGVCLAIGICLFYFIRYTNIFKGKHIPIVVMFMLMFSLILTGSRAAMVGMVISLFPFFIPSNGKGLKFAFGLVILIGIIVLFGAQTIDTIINSLVHTDSVSGSNREMRENQWNIVLYYFYKSPIVGNGLLYTWTTVRNQEHGIYGAESLWFPVLIEQGVLGCLSYICFFYSCIRYTIINKVMPAFFFVAGFLIFNSLSSIPCFDFYFIIIYVIILVYAKRFLSENNLNYNSRL